jgi:glycosyltransferase involved in cell wall biosynthesis
MWHEAADLGDTRGWQLPAADILSFAPRRSRYALCVFVLNEGDRIRRQLERMRPWTGGVDVLLADGGSSDGSTDPGTLRAAGVHALLIKRGPGRLSTQMRMALAHALRAGYEGVLVMDGNDKDDPAAVPRFVDALDRGADHVQGSRFVPGGRAINTPPSRYWAIRLLHAPLLSLAAGFRYTDTTNGFRAYSRRLLLDPRVRPFRDVFSAYELHYYLAIRAAELGFRVCEVPVTRSYPAAGPVPTKLHGLHGHWVVLRTLLAACLRLFHPHTC